MSSLLELQSSGSTERLELIGTTIIELNITRKNMLIYPPTHEQVRRSLERTYDRFKTTLNQINPLKLCIMPDGILVEGRPLDPKSSAIQQFAATLKQYGVVVLVVTPMPLKAHLGRFIQLLTTDPEKLRAQGGITAEVNRQQLKNIDVRMMDYSKLHLTEEREIRQSRQSKDKGAASSVWQQFVNHVLNAPAGIDVSGSNMIDPSRLADLINARNIDVQQATGVYNQVIDDLLDDGSSHDTWLTIESEELAAVVELIRSLEPEFQELFLSATFDKVSTQKSGIGASKLFRSMDKDLVFRMFSIAKSQSKPISPSLVAFINKMGSVEQQAPSSGAPDDNALASLLNREAYESYVDSGYDRMLTGLDRQIGNHDHTEAYVNLRKELAADLEDARINHLVAKALMSLMTICETIDEYRDWAKQVSILLDDLVANSEFSNLMAIYDYFVREEKYQTDPDRSKIVSLVLKRFEDAQFITKIVNIVDQPTGSVAPGTMPFLIRIGEPVIGEILDRMAADQILNSESALYRILEQTPALVVKEATARMTDADPDHICFMLKVVRKLAAEQNIDGIKSLLDHSDPKVRREALATLLKLKNVWGTLRLRDLLNEPWSPIVHDAIELAGKYKVLEVSQALLALVLRKGPLGADIGRRTSALKALGAIGDIQTLPQLKQLARRKGFMAKKYLLQLKRVLFQSLDGFPYEAIKDLLHYGVNQSDAIIHSECEHILRRHHTGK